MTKLSVPALTIGVFFYIFILEVSCQTCDPGRCEKDQYCCGDNECCYNCTVTPCDSSEYCCGNNQCCSKEWQDKTWPWIIIVIGAIILFFVLAAIIYYCSVRRKRSRGYQQIYQTDPKSGAGADDEPSEQTPLLAGGGASPEITTSDQKPVSTSGNEETPQDEDEPTPDVLVSIVDEKAQYEASSESTPAGDQEKNTGKVVDTKADVDPLEDEKSKDEDILQMDDVPMVNEPATSEVETPDQQSDLLRSEGEGGEAASQEHPETLVEPKEPQPEEKQTGLEGHFEEKQTSPETEAEEHDVEPDAQEKEQLPEDVRDQPERKDESP
ncbi:uncharacterized protein LOC100368161 [Saccoglossus kowalevskii]|uniref:Nucleolin 2-like n=1 Tax=Saccoglossus kowalevskii TaxID=10224 RepID=A0ABM0H1M3_SACKO|nr:PREDICTED: nucleolin 2-like [Saccoglossus kowalevskii]